MLRWTLISCCAVSCSLLTAQDVSFEERLLATIPDNLEVRQDNWTDSDGQNIPRDLPIVWSPDGRAAAYVGRRGGRWHPVVDDKVGEGYDYAEYPVFDPTGKHVVFRVGKRGKKNRWRWWILLDGKKVASHDRIRPVAVNAAGKLAYWEQPGAERGEDGRYLDLPWVLHIGRRRARQQWNDCQEVAPLWGPGGKRVVALAREGEAWFLVVAEGSKVKTVGEAMTRTAGCTMSPDGARVAVVVHPAGYTLPAPPDDVAPIAGMRVAGFFVELEGERYGGDYDISDAPVFGPGSEHLAYRVAADWRMGIAVDNREVGPTFDYVGKPVFSPNAERIAYAASRGVKTRMSIAGEEEPRLDGGKTVLVVEDLADRRFVESKPWVRVANPRFSEDGRSVAYAALEKGRWRIVVGDVESEVYDAVGPPVFSDDGRRVAFGARAGKLIWWKVMELEPR